MVSDFYFSHYIIYYYPIIFFLQKIAVSQLESYKKILLDSVSC